MRYLVTFVGAELDGCVDASAFSVRASTRTAAIAARKGRVQHPWVLARAVPWPAGIVDADDAIAALVVAS